MSAQEFKPAELREMAENAAPLHKSALRFIAELFEMADDSRYSNEMIGIRVRNQLNHL